ncbi:cytochrome c1 [Orientia chuto str. Dubai]|uniref:Cytochrome c1 n=1 Tax=Orientia chuto str. Dubai TaxID=1359168 RepID=A0A0F3MKH2_9RICK|nr:cytochrome c1 [Candidatus Orientia mediorientalis]KJV56283.1 cytochrome c1 [Orientia chuto str. Dubai]
MQQIRIFIYLIIQIVGLVVLSTAYGEALMPKKLDWPFNGILGKLDVQAAQRGFKVYKEVCSACHSLKYVSYRNLADIGFSEDEIKAVAGEYNFQDGPNDQGEMFERPGLPSDQFYNPFPNEKAARAANGGSYPVDLSLIIKAREKGANYVYSLLTGYIASPEGFSLEPGLYYNPYFSTQKIAMPPPLTDQQVNYSDGTNSSIEQMAKDVVIFLQWAAEPEMKHRKSLGLKVIIFLIIFSTIFYIAKERIWSDVKDDKPKN